MDKNEVIAHLCELVSHVGREVFRSKIEHDCFCGGQDAVFGKPMFQTVHPEVIAFIDSAVFAAVKARKG